MISLIGHVVLRDIAIRSWLYCVILLFGHVVLRDLAFGYVVLCDIAIRSCGIA